MPNLAPFDKLVSCKTGVPPIQNDMELRLKPKGDTNFSSGPYFITHPYFPRTRLRNGRKGTIASTGLLDESLNIICIGTDAGAKSASIKNSGRRQRRLTYES